MKTLLFTLLSVFAIGASAAENIIARTGSSFYSQEEQAHLVYSVELLEGSKLKVSHYFLNNPYGISDPGVEFVETQEILLDKFEALQLGSMAAQLADVELVEEFHHIVCMMMAPPGRLGLYVENSSKVLRMVLSDQGCYVRHVVFPLLEKDREVAEELQSRLLKIAKDAVEAQL